MKALEDLSIYGRIFDESSSFWSIIAEDNLYYIRAVERHYNELLRKRGYVFLRDIYEELGFHITKESIIVGWIYDGNNDNYIDFGLDSHDEPDNPNVLLDFNVDGVIYDKF